MSVAVITDSTASLPAALAAQWGITVVPLRLKIGYRIDDESRFTSPELIDAMRSGVPASTTPPEEPAFFWAYQEAAARGAEAVVSLHISGRMSETVQVARNAAARSRVPVHVLDSESTGMSLGFAALSAGRAAAAGATPQRTVEVAERRFRESTELIYVDTLEYLRRGGRIGAASAMIGTALSLKPVLTMRDGEVAGLTKVAGSKRAITKMVDLAVEKANGRQVDLAISHFGPDPRVAELSDTLRRRLPECYEPAKVDVSAVIGAHLGPGALGVTISPTG